MKQFFKKDAFSPKGRQWTEAPNLECNSNNNSSNNSNTSIQHKHKFHLMNEKYQATPVNHEKFP